LEHFPQTQSQPGGVCCIDDTFSHKTGKHIENVEKHFDHAEGRYVLAHNLVTCQYKDRRVSYAIDFRPYYRFNEKQDKQKLKEQLSDVGRQIELFDERQRQIEKLKLLLIYELRKRRFKTKIELACELVDSTETLGIKAKTYVFDSWFLSKRLTNHIRAYGKDWISVLKSNRILLIKGQRVPLSQFIASLPKEAFKKINLKNGKCYWVFTKSVKLPKIGKVRIVISYTNQQLSGDPMTLVTNRRDWEAVKIVSTYLLRSGVDAFYRDAKQHLGLEDYQLRAMRGIRRHWYLVFLAHSFLLLNGLRSKLVKRLKSNLGTIGQSSRAMCDELTVSLIAWIYKYLQYNKLPLEVADLLTR